MSNTYRCLECGKTITEGVHIFSTKVHGFPLCLKHQCWIVESDASPEAKALYFALHYNGLPVVLDYTDGKQVKDVAIPGKLFIEMDAKQAKVSDEAFTDLFLDFYSWKGQIPTFKMPAAAINNPKEFRHAVTRLVEICTEFRQVG